MSLVSIQCLLVCSCFEIINFMNFWYYNLYSKGFFPCTCTVLTISKCILLVCIWQITRKSRKKITLGDFYWQFYLWPLVSIESLYVHSGVTRGGWEGGEYWSGCWGLVYHHLFIRDDHFWYCAVSWHRLNFIVYVIAMLQTTKASIIMS